MENQNVNQNKMKAKLVKREDRFDLYDEQGHKIASTLDGAGNKLSIKNCQEIELGYDLEELAYSCFPNGTYETSEINLGLDMYKKGFQKALELLGDKKYSEDDLIEAYSRGQTNSPIQSLQQTEWDVEIIQGGNYFFVIKTEEWAFDSIDDLKKIIGRIEESIKNFETENKKIYTPAKIEVIELKSTSKKHYDELFKKNKSK